MTIGELLKLLTRAIAQGRLSEDDEVLVRNTAVGEEAMEAGSDGYESLTEVLIDTETPAARLLIEE